MAFFNNTRDEDTYDDYPLIREFHETDSTKFVALRNWVKQNEPAREKEIVQFVKMQQPAINSIAADELKNAALMDTKWLVFRNKAVARLKDIDLTNKTELMYRYPS
jgi:predicted XRE-type DNA-binding protein